MLRRHSFVDNKNEIHRSLFIQIKDLQKIIELEKNYPEILNHLDLIKLNSNDEIEIFDLDLINYLCDLYWIINYDDFFNFSIDELEIAINNCNQAIINLEKLLQKGNIKFVKEEILKREHQKRDIISLKNQKEQSNKKI